MIGQTLRTLTAIALMLPGQATPPDGAPQGQANLDLLRVVVLDISGSMRSPDHGSSRLDVARNELISAVAQFPPTLRAPVVLIPFAGSVDDARVTWHEELASFQTAITALQPDGNTDIAAGLLRAVEVVQPTAAHVTIYLASDGEQTVGGLERVEMAERELDKLFGQRSERGLSQTVVVKRWGGVNADLVAHLRRNPDVDVYDVGELAFRTATIIPSVRVRSAHWLNPHDLLARLDLDVVLDVRSATQIPADAELTIACLVPGHQWLSQITLPIVNSSKGHGVVLIGQHLNLLVLLTVAHFKKPQIICAGLHDLKHSGG